MATEEEQMSDQETTTFSYDGWAIVELMGHRRRAGKVSTVELGGTALIRVDSPVGEGVKTEVYNVSALYCLTPVDEAAARVVAQTIGSVAPVSRWDLASLERAALPTPAYSVEDDDAYGEQGWPT